MHHTARARAAGLALVIAAAAAAGSTSFPAARAAIAAVDITDDGYSPATVRIAPGDSVTWTHRGTSPHTVTWDDGSPGSGPLVRTQTYTRTFPEVGSYRYRSDFRTAMTGVVVVARSEPPPPAPTTAPPTTRPPRAAPTTTSPAPADTTTTIVTAPPATGSDTPPPPGAGTTDTTFPAFGGAPSTFPSRPSPTVALRDTGGGAPGPSRRALTAYALLAAGLVASGLSWRRTRDRRLLDSW